jgi:hypothetical protein
MIDEAKTIADESLMRLFLNSGFNKQLAQLRAQTTEIERELDLRKKLRPSLSDIYIEARMKLLEANRTPEEKRRGWKK